MKSAATCCLCLAMLLTGCRDERARAPRPADTQPATAPQVLGHATSTQEPAPQIWESAMPGDSITIVAGDEPRIVTTERVLQVRDGELVIERTIQIGADSPTTRMEVHAMETYDPRGVVVTQRRGNRVATRQMLVGQQPIQAEVYETDPPGSSLLRTYISQDVPGQWVRAEEVINGTTSVLAEVTEFHKASPSTQNAPATAP